MPMNTSSSSDPLSPAAPSRGLPPGRSLGSCSVESPGACTVSALPALPPVLLGDLDSCSHSVLPRAHHLSYSPSLVPRGLCTRPGKKHLGPGNAKQPSLTRPSGQWTLQLGALRWAQPCRMPFLMRLHSREMENEAPGQTLTRSTAHSELLWKPGFGALIFWCLTQCRFIDSTGTYSRAVMCKVTWK